MEYTSLIFLFFNFWFLLVSEHDDWFLFLTGHQLTEEERDELLATTAYFFVQRTRKATAFKNQSK